MRSSLLYADHVNLVAPSAAWLNTFSPLLDLDSDDPWLSVASLPSETLHRIGVEEVTFRDFRRAMRKLADRPYDDPQRLEGERLWRPALVKAKQQAVEVFDSAEVTELGAALATGSVSMISDGTRLEESTEQQIRWFRDRLIQALADPNSSVLLDQATTKYLRDEGEYVDGLPHITDVRARRAALGTGLMERLPTFPDAPMGHVLEAREELAQDRAAYRSAVKDLSSKLASSALDDTLPSEIDELWQDDVRPKLESLRKNAKKTRVGVETAKRLVTEGYGMPTLFVAVANFADLAAALPDSAAAAAGITRVAVAGAQEAMKARAAVRQHDLVYLLDVNDKLSKSRKF